MATQKAPAVTTSGTVTDPRKAFQRYKDALTTEAGMTESEFDGQEISEQIGAKIIAADSLEAAVEAQEATGLSGQDIVGVEHEVISYDMKKTTKADATRPVYYLVRAVALEDKPRLGLTVGEEFYYSVGGGNVVDVLYVARTHDRLPLRIMLTEKGTTGDNKILLVKLLPKRVL
jgi:hypothetical protein